MDDCLQMVSRQMTHPSYCSEEGDDCLTCRGVSLIEFAREMFNAITEDEIYEALSDYGFTVISVESVKSE